MSKELSSQNMVVITRIGDYWVTEAQSANIAKILESSAKGLIGIDDNYVAINAIEGVITPAAYEVLNNKRRGAWQCNYGHWHDKFDKCAHYEQKRIDRSLRA